LVNPKYISEKYKTLVNSKIVINDDGQKEVLEALDTLYYLIKSPFSIRNFFKRKKIMGAYIYGKVGRGKSYLMDIFYKSIFSKHSLRIHQHVFMYQIYEYMKQANSLNNKNPFKYAVDQFTKNLSMLCVDEFEVLDVADAMILERLYRELYKKNIFVVLTSNTKPTLLYKNGLQRTRFLPFIELINNLMIVREIGEGKDYRVKNDRTNDLINFQEFYFVSNSNLLLEKLFLFLSNKNKIIGLDINYHNRKMHIDKSSNSVVFFSFDDLCGLNYSYIDYINLAEKFSWFIISDVPKLLSKDRNKAKRFQVLLDILYDEKIGLAVSSKIMPKDIYKKGDGSEGFSRTISRLYEMTNRGWLYKIKDKRFKDLFNL
tara:strand:- start:213 stop:1328 length:1116 start_codon:yes stop_codon:yes gene_type:complete